MATTAAATGAKTGIWGNIFSAVLGGISSGMSQRSSERATREATEQAGKEDRRTAAFTDQMEYFRMMQMRKEKQRSLDSNYRQFSTVRNFKPNFVAGSGLDAMPDYPDPEDFD